VTPDPAWRTSSRCGNAACVEVAQHDGRWLLRDSKGGEGGNVLAFTGEEWARFVAGIKAGDFDVPAGAA
jgi:hypothetical protein